jgi:hypothetical protein
VVVDLSAELHPYILKILKPYLALGVPPSQLFDVGLALGILGTSGQGPNRARIEFPPREFSVIRVMFYCRTCGDTLPSNVFSYRSGRVVCNPCGNRQRVPKRRLVGVQKQVGALNAAVATSLRQQLLVVPVPQGWHPDIA